MPGEAWFLAGLCWILAVSPILSPQFLVWVVPLLAWQVLRDCTEKIDVPTLLVCGLTVALGLLTQWIYPYHYGDLIDTQTVAAVLILNARNCALFILSGVLLFQTCARKRRVQS